MDAFSTLHSILPVLPVPALSGLEIPALEVGVPLLFAAAYLLVVLEEFTHMRKSKPVMLAAGLIWLLIALFPPTPNSGHESGVTTGDVTSTVEDQEREAFPANGAVAQSAELVEAREAVGEAVRHYLLEYGELFLFLLVAMTYVNAMEERKVFDVLRDKLISSGMSYRALFWATGFLSFFVSPVLDNMTTALVTFAALAAVGRESPRFVALGCINLVVAANAGGAFSPFGDITTLMVWQDGKLPFFDFFHLFVPSLVNFVVPAACMHFAIPKGKPPATVVRTRFKRGAVGVMVFFGLTVVTAVCMHNFLHLPPVLGMMTGLAYLKLYSYYLTRTTPHADASISDRDPEDVAPFDSFRLVARAEWDTLLFFYGVMLCVGGLGYVGYLNLAAETIYEGWGPMPANIAIGVLSAVVDNIPVMMAVLEMSPDMTAGHWLLVTLTAGVGGSMLSIGSAAGVALMGQSRGIYTFGRHLVWTPAVALGYVLSILTHLWINHSLFIEPTVN